MEDAVVPADDVLEIEVDVEDAGLLVDETMTVVKDEVVLTFELEPVLVDRLIVEVEVLLDVLVAVVVVVLLIRVVVALAVTVVGVVVCEEALIEEVLDVVEEIELDVRVNVVLVIEVIMVCTRVGLNVSYFVFSQPFSMISLCSGPGPTMVVLGVSIHEQNVRKISLGCSTKLDHWPA